VTMAVIISRKRDVRKKRSAGSAGTLAKDAEAAIGDHFILALRRSVAERTARNDNVYGFNDNLRACGFASGSADSESAARAILRVRFETGSVEKSSNGMLRAP
jgi:hypothetical protein